MAAAMWAPIAGFLLVLPALLLPPAASSAAMVFPLHGNVYPSGRFFVTMNIGVPAKPYFLDIDTGSDLTWVPNQLYEPKGQNMVRANDPLCAALHEDGWSGDGNHMLPTQCDYEIKYADGASTIGALIVDQFSFPRIATRPNLPFGCGYNQGVGENFQQTSPVNGILGLDRGKVSFVSQLKMLGIITKHVVGHCLSSGGGGLLFVGDDDGNLVPSSRVTWVPMSRSNINTKNYYSPGSATLYFDRHSLGMNPMDVVFDSGSTYTYFTGQPYQATVYAIKGGLSSTSLEQVSDPSLPLCWKGQKAFESVSDVKKEFKSLQLNFDITMQDQMVIYDNEREQLGWIRGSCGRSPTKSVMSLFP
uniref:Peptidase A1 domain-containing protein n=1 Tax=Oryza meridionalis TaxID=40149 RepID=A0A0E0F341_9ORYZ